MTRILQRIKPPGQFKLLIMENTVRSFDDAQINLDFSGIPDDVEVTIDAWVAKASDLEEDDFVVDQALNQAGDADADDVPAIWRMTNSRSTKQGTWWPLSLPKITRQAC